MVPVIQKTVLSTIRDHQDRLERIKEDLIQEGISRASTLKLAREMGIPEELIQDALGR